MPSVPNKTWFGTVTADVAFDPDLSPAAKAVYLVLVMFRNRDDDTCFPSNETLVQKTGVSLSTVKRAVVELTEAGVIRRERRFRDGRETTSLTFLTDAVAVRSDPPGGHP